MTMEDLQVTLHSTLVEMQRLVAERDEERRLLTRISQKVVELSGRLENVPGYAVGMEPEEGAVENSCTSRDIEWITQELSDNKQFCLQSVNFYESRLQDSKFVLDDQLRYVLSLKVSCFYYSGRF